MIVENYEPLLTLSGTETVDEGGTYTLNLQSSDPGDDTIYEWMIDWGDGSTETFTDQGGGSWLSNWASNPGVMTQLGDTWTATHVYADNGDYTVNATARDEDGDWQAYGPLGTLDRHFGADATGWVSEDFGVDRSTPMQVLVQSDGKIIVAGHILPSGSYEYDFAMVRYNADGTIDTTFGENNDGLATVNWNSASYCYDVALQSNGKIVLVGYTDDDGYAIALARFTSDGILDSGLPGVPNDGFGGNDLGYVFKGAIYEQRYVYGLAILPDSNDIIVAGKKSYDYTNALVAKFDADGAVDTNFGSSGELIFNYGMYSSGIYDLELLWDSTTPNDIVLVGAGYSNYNHGLFFFDAGGSPLNSINSDGVVEASLVGGQDYANGLAIDRGTPGDDSDDRIVTGGYADGDTALARFEPSGDPLDNFVLDDGFDIDGGAGSNDYWVDVNSDYDSASGVVILPSGRIISAGSTYYDGLNWVSLISLDGADGSLSSDFGTDGKLTLDFSAGHDAGTSIALTEDGDILVSVASYSADYQNSYFTLARLYGENAGHKITVNNVSPTLTVYEDHTVNADNLLSISDIGTFTDPGYTSSETFTCEIDWGDGSDIDYPSADITCGSPGVATAGSFDGSHTYTSPGAYTVTVTVTDDDGEADSDTFTVVVYDDQGRIVVTTVDDSVDPDDQYISLREALTLASDKTGDDTIVFQDGLTGTITLGGTQLEVTSNVTIEGPGADLLTIDADSDGDGVGNSRVFYIYDAVNPVTATISGLTITGGSETSGGGIYCGDYSDVYITDSVISDNHATGTSNPLGGGIYISATADVDIYNTTIAGNSAKRGGGIYSSFGSLDIFNTAMVGNTASWQGGAILIYGGSAVTTITNATIAGNKANDSYGGGICAESAYSLTIYNSIVSLNDGYGEIYDNIYITGGSSAPHLHFNLINATSEQVGFIRDPDPGDDGWDGTDDDYGNLRLKPGSPAIDQGDNTFAVDKDSNPLATDLDGNPRKVQITQDAVDKGAYEYQGEIIVTTLEDDDSKEEGTNDPYNQYISLREALQMAHDFDWEGDDTIVFQDGLTGTITLNGDQLDVDSNVTIVGPGADLLTIDADGGSRVFYIYDSVNPVTATISGLTITGGSETSGGGIYCCDYSDVCITDSVISDNHATGTSNPLGGGIYISATADVDICNTTIAGNSAKRGGGIYSFGSLDIVNTAMVGNTASWQGGAILIYGTSAVTTITNATIAGNKANDSYGGGIYDDSAYSLTIYNSIISLNDGYWESYDNIHTSGTSCTYYSKYTLISATSEQVGFIRDPDDGGDGWGDDPDTEYIDESANDDYGNLRLTSDNYAKDRGNKGYVSDITYDLDGNPRIYGDDIDKGAYEYQGKIIVTTLDDDDSEDPGTSDPYNLYISLREALAIAADWAGDDTIVFQDGLTGTITLNGNQLEVDSNVTIEGPGADLLTIDADDSSRVFCIDTNDVTASISGLTITGGSANQGGGIYIVGTDSTHSVLNLSEVVITGNYADVNSSLNYGGGIYCGDYSEVSITNSVITDNHATGSSNPLGGGIHIIATASVVVSNTTIAGNSATKYGGGIYNYGSLDIVNTAMVGNSAGWKGGAMRIYGGSAVTHVTNSTIAKNYACSAGGGICIDDSNDLTINNSIVSLNTVGNISGNGSSGYDGSNNLVVDYPGDPGFIRNPNDGGDGWGDDPDTEYIDESDNDDYGNLRLKPGSPAIDQGNNTAAEGITYDLDGNPRRVQITQDAVDIGAYEYQGVIVVTTLEDDDSESEGTSDPCNQYISLREALQMANDFDWEGDDTIVFQDGLTGTITLNGSQLVVDSNVVIQGPGSDLLTIDADSDGDGVGNSRVFYIYDAVNPVTATISGLTITGGGTEIYGGGICVKETSELILEDSTVTGNAATYGGGIYGCTGSSIEVYDSTITDNEVSFHGGGINSNGTLTVESSTISENGASRGAGIYGGSNSYLEVSNSTSILDNEATSTGGGIDAYGTLLLTDTTVSGNSAGDYGGGVRSQASSTFTNSTISDNDSNYGGGIYCSVGSSVTVQSGSVVSDNEAYYGGGIYVKENGSIAVDDSTISLNTATTQDGGGIYCCSDCEVTITSSAITGNEAGYRGGGITLLSSAYTATISNSIVSGNKATISASGSGGGIYLTADATVSIKNTALAGNITNLDGGGLYVYTGGTATLTNVTIASNTAGGYGGGIKNLGTLTVNNSIVSLNTAASDPNISGTLEAGSNNNLTTENSAEVGFIRDPFFNGIDDYGNLRLKPGSPVIDQGSNTAAQDITYDLDGNPRKVQITQDAVDIGAYEYQGVIVVTTLDDDDSEDGGTDDPYDSKVSLREALKHADTYDWEGDDDIITFQESLNGGTITLDGEDLDVDCDVIIDGPGAEQLTIDAGSHSRVFYVASYVEATISGLTITGGYAYGTGEECNGGGIYIDSDSTLTVNHSTITDNSTCNYRTYSDSEIYEGNGGGIYAGEDSTIIVTNNSTISDNRTGNGYSGQGAGIYGADGSTIRIEYSTVSQNKTGTAYYHKIGGGISGGSDSTIIVTYSNILNNEAAYAGGGIFGTDGSTITVENSTVMGNKLVKDCSNHSGGGICGYQNNTITVENSIISENGMEDMGRYDKGGGIYLGDYYYGHHSTLTINNSSIVDNVSGSYGGGIYTEPGDTVTVTNSTIAGNYAPTSGGGIYTDAMYLYNSIISLNKSISGSDNLDGGLWSTSSNYLIGGDLAMSAVTDENGVVLYYRPQPGCTEVIDQGDNALVVDPDGTDQLGNPRIYNGTVDIGAIELNDDPQLVITPTPDVLYEGEAVTVDVSLSADPGQQITVAIAKQSGGSEDVWADRIYLIFDSTNWDVPQTVTIAANAEFDWDNPTARFTFSTDSMDTVRLDVEVESVPPVLTMFADSTVDEGGVYTLNLESSDPDDETITEWTIDWGDGSTETFTKQGDDTWLSTGVGMLERINANHWTATHAYADNGDYTIKAWARDEYCEPGEAYSVFGHPGTVDPYFGYSGWAAQEITFEDTRNNIAIQPDGKIVLVGTTFIENQPAFAISRFNQDGTPDSTFFEDGITTLDVTGIGEECRARDVAIPDD